MSSRQACELIVDGRAFLSLQAVVRVRLERDAEVVCPIRVELHADQATLYTGFTEVSAAVTRRVHDQLLRRLRRACEREDLVLGREIRRLAEQITARAAEESPDEADILAPPPAADDGVEENGEEEAP